MTPERRAELHEERKALLERARAIRDANRAARAEEREMSQIQAMARFETAPPPVTPERFRPPAPDQAQINAEAVADYEEAKAEALRNMAPEDVPAVLKMPPIVHEGAVAPPRVVEPEEQHIEPETESDNPITPFDERPVPGDDFERFLAAQDVETREVLSDVELRVIFETETKRAQEERRAQVRKAAAARALRHAKATAGLIGPEAIAAAALRDRLSQKVEWTVNMPEAGNSGMLIDEGVRINGRLMQHGERITGTLAEYESYRAIEWNAHQSELDFQGRGKLSKLRQTATGFLNMRGAA